MKEWNVAVMGATGAVGTCFLQILEERDFPVKNLKLLASERSHGKKIKFRGKSYPVELLSGDSFREVELVLSSAGAARSKEFLPSAVAAGAVCVDNSSAFRYDPEIPLVVPEVNPQDIKKHKGIIANPNCSTIQMVVALKPLYDAAGIERIVVSTYQSVSGAGAPAAQELIDQTKTLSRHLELEAKIFKPHEHSEDVRHKVFPHDIAFNLIPQIDIFMENDYTKEEMKMVWETQKIMGDPSIKVTATCVRVPVFLSHSEAVNIQTKKKLSADQARKILKNSPGVVIVDDPEAKGYPMPIDAAGKDEVFVGRIREDESIENGLNLWIVSDNLRKGAALNAIQIAELL